jgi:hypothetical protein
MTFTHNYMYSGVTLVFHLGYLGGLTATLTAYYIGSTHLAFQRAILHAMNSILYLSTLCLPYGLHEGREAQNLTASLGPRSVDYIILMAGVQQLSKRGAFLIFRALHSNTLLPKSRNGKSKKAYRA